MVAFTIRAREAISPSSLKSRRYFGNFYRPSAAERVNAGMARRAREFAHGDRRLPFRQSADDPDCHLSISFSSPPLPSVCAREAILPIPLKSPPYFDLVDRSQRCRKGKG